VEGFRTIIAQSDIAPVVVHASYLVNLASPDRALYHRSLQRVADDMARAARLGGQSVVLHFGHHMGRGVDWALRRSAGGVRSLLDGAPAGLQLLLENAAGRGTELGGNWQHFAVLLDHLAGDERVGICLDTCHAHAAGYRLDSARWIGRALQTFHAAIGLDRIRLIHLSDSRGPAGSHQDLHEHIGRGTISNQGFRALLRRRALRGLCGILETPIREEGDDERNLARAKRLRGRAGRQVQV
jgi:deoxyribonuclease-4